MPRSSTNNRIWGDVEQFDTGKAVAEVALYYLSFVVVAGLVNTLIISQVLLLANVSRRLQWALIVGFGISIIAAAIVGFRAASNGAKGLSLQRVTMEKAPSLMNLTEGLCVSMGIEMPRVLELCEPQINVAAFSVGNKRAVIVITSGALEAFTRLEYEAILARELARIRSGEIFFEARMRALEKMIAPIFPFIIPKKQSKELTAQLIAGDLAGVFFTRYPVAMISVLKAMQIDPHARTANSSIRRRVLAPYWMHPELGDADLTPRIKELESY